MKTEDRTTAYRTYSARASITLLALLLTAGVGYSQSAAGQANGGGTADAPQIEEIIVTAQKVSESLQKAPAAISVVTGADIVDRQMLDVRSLTTFVPSIETNLEATATQFFIRGVGKQVDQGRIPDAVGMVIDGLTVPQHDSGMALFDMHDIEVLPGPQGTLYGSSAIGGVVNLTTNRPTQTLESSVLADVGNYGTVDATGITNIPLNADWSVRAGYNARYHDGYDSNGAYNDHLNTFRLSSLYAPQGGTISLFLTGTYWSDDFEQGPTVPFPYSSGGAYSIPHYDSATAFFYPPNGLSNSLARTDQHVASMSGRLDWSPGDITISYIPAYLHSANPNVQRYPQNAVEVVAGFYELYTSDINQFSNEIRVSNSAGSRLRWLGGLYQTDSRNHEFLDFGPNLSGDDYTTNWKGYAAYGQGTYSVTDSTRVTLGLRESQDRLVTNNGQVFFPTGAPPDFGRGIIPFSFDQSWTRLNWKAGFEQDLGRNSMLYAAAQTGFNPGTFDGNAPNPGREVQPQTMLGYTAGVKNRLLNSRLTLNVEGYVYNYKNQIITAPNLSNGETALLNAPKSRTYGTEIDVAYAVTHDTKIHVTYGYLNAKFLDFEAGSAAGPVNYAGYALPFSPKSTADFGADHVFELGDRGSVTARFDTYASSSYWFTYDNLPGFMQGGYTRTDASIVYTFPNPNWQVGIWAKNLENKGVAASAGEVAGRSYPGVVYVDAPRTFGARLFVKF